MKLKELVLQTAVFDLQYKFYSEVLELPVEKINADRFVIHAGTTEMFFVKALAGTNPVYHFAFNIPSNKPEEARAWLQKRVDLLWLEDYRSDVADFTNWHARAVYFLDPAGNILEFIARFDLDDPAGAPFSSIHIRNLSEIGLVFSGNNFDDEVNTIMNRYGLGYFSKQPPMPQFRAIGNDEGLFVIVPEGRVWFSTKDTKAQVFPLEILFEENDELYQLNW